MIRPDSTLTLMARTRDPLQRIPLAGVLLLCFVGIIINAATVGRARIILNFHQYTDFRHFYAGATMARRGQLLRGRPGPSDATQAIRRAHSKPLVDTPSVLLRVSVPVGGTAFRSCAMGLVGRNGTRDRDLRMPSLRPGPRAYGDCLLLVLALVVESTPRPGCGPGITVYGRRVVGFVRPQELVAGGTSVFALSDQIQSPSAVPAADDGEARKTKMAVGCRISGRLRVSGRDFISCLRIGMAASIPVAHLQSAGESSFGGDA